jgi:hypothetical protein
MKMKIAVNKRRAVEDDPKPYQADVWFEDGRDYHAIGETPARALLELAMYWIGRDVVDKRAEDVRNAATALDEYEINAAKNLRDNGRF